MSRARSRSVTGASHPDSAQAHGAVRPPRSLLEISIYGLDFIAFPPTWIGWLRVDEVWWDTTAHAGLFLSACRRAAPVGGALSNGPVLSIP